MGFDDMWENADPEGNNDTAPEDGIYDVALVDANAFTSKGGHDLVTLEWQTADKEHQWTSLHGFKTMQAAGFTKGTVMKLGVDPSTAGSLSELDAALKPCVGRYFEVEVKRNGDFVNTYVNDGQGPAPDVPADTSGMDAPKTEDGDPVPF